MTFLSDGKHAHSAGISDKSEILEKIRDAEKKAEKIVADAETQRQKIVEDAHKKAADVQAAAAEKIKGGSDAELKAFYNSISKKKEKILSNCAAGTAAMKKQAEKKLPEAVDFLHKRFEESMRK